MHPICARSSADRGRRRRYARRVQLGRDFYLDRWSRLHGGVDPRGSRWISGWLSVTYAAARPLAARGVSPDVLTATGVLVAAGVPALAALGGRWPLLAVVLVVASALVDSLDGAVAVLRDAGSRFGVVLDAIADRCSEALLLTALWVLGAPPWLCAAAGAVTMLHESTRAQARSVGETDVGVITVSERPTRVIVASFTLFGAGLVPGSAAVVATAGAAIGAALALAGWAQLLLVTRRALR